MWTPSKGCRRRSRSNRKHQPQSPVHRRDRHRNLRLSASAAVCPCRFVLFPMRAEITAQTVQQMVDAIYELPEGSRSFRFFPHPRKEYRKRTAGDAQGRICARRINGEMVDLGEDITLDKQKKHTISPRRRSVDDEARRRCLRMRRIADSRRNVAKLAGGLVGVLETGKLHLYSDKLACIKCGVSYPRSRCGYFRLTAPRRLSGLRWDRVCHDSRCHGRR